MQSSLEQVELIRAAIVLAAADGKISSSERGLLEAFAKRIGIGKASLDAMIDRAITDHTVREEMFRRSMSDPKLTLELLVATARLDGDITTKEREVLIHARELLEIPMDEFAQIYEQGIKRADTLRKTKFSTDS